MSGDAPNDGSGIGMLAEMLPHGTLNRLGVVREGRRVALLLAWTANGEGAATAVLIEVPNEEAWRQKIVDTVVQTWPDRALDSLEEHGAVVRALPETLRFVRQLAEGEIADLTEARAAASALLESRG